VFCGQHLLTAKLRPSNIDGSAGAVEKVARIVGQVRARWPRTRILPRADSGFAREALMARCEENRVGVVFGLARNARLVEEIAVELLEAEAEASSTGKPAHRYKDFRYATLDSRSRRRRVIGKAERTQGEANPRFIVTSLSKAETNARFLREIVYCARGDMENRIKECGPRQPPCASQLRLWLASLAYVLLCAVRRIGLAQTQFAEATCGTIRLKLLKLAGLVHISARRIKFVLASACPYADEWRLAAARLP
jgi:Transposase DDE domain group 1